MLNLAEYRQRPALLADWLPWAGLIAPGVVLNKDGSFQRTARFRGPDLDSATQGELIATTARLNNALRRLGSGWALFVEAERQPAADYPHSDFPEPLSWLVDEERRAAFEESGNHFESAISPDAGLPAAGGIPCPGGQAALRACAGRWRGLARSARCLRGGNRSRVRPTRWRDAGNRLAR